MRNLCFLLILLFLSASCRKAETESTEPVVSALSCSSASTLSYATVDSSYTDTLTIPYTGGNGRVYQSGSPVASTGVTGLTATLLADTLNTGSGVINYHVSGTPSAPGIASFVISFASKSCGFQVTVKDKPFIQYGIPFAAVPDPRDAVIYQVNMRAFSPGRNFQGVIDRLDSIKALGINVIYLMPTYPIGTLHAINSPYCIKDYLGVNPEFGTLTDLRNLIEGAHARGMAVIMDWVANHTSWDHSWIAAHKDWYSQDGSGNIVSPPGWNDVAQLNFNSSAMINEMIRSMKYWIYTVNCDGYRCDYAEGPPYAFWSEAITELRSISTHKLLMLAESNNNLKFSAGFDFIFGFNFYANLKSIYSANLTVQSIDNINTNDYLGITDSKKLVVRYLTNHDVNSTGTPLDWFGGKNGSMAAFVVAAYMKGTPMIYNGQEVGTSFPLNFITLGPTINWNQNPGMVEEYKKIIAFRNSSEAIRRGVLHSYSSPDICAFTKTSANETVLVLSNLRNSTVTYSIPSAVANTTWVNAFNGNSISLGNQLIIQPYDYLILKK